MQCIALDLETTGLDPNVDHIVEIAAIRFSLSIENGQITPQIHDERHMLVDPECDLSREFSLITGITPDMLKNKKKWEDIHQSVEDFLMREESIIVGHNVLFDIAMLQSHGITFRSDQQILDTFELAELFSYEAESLNLSFLCEHHALPLSGEHRALDDTKMSMNLLTYYLNNARSFSEKERIIFSFLLEKTRFGSLPIFLTLLRDFSFFNDIPCEDVRTLFPGLFGSYGVEGESESRDLLSTSGISLHRRNISPETEGDFLRSLLERESTTLLIVSGADQVDALFSLREKLWGDQSHRIMTFTTPDHFLSPQRFLQFLTDTRAHSLERKESIIALRLLLWLARTESGSLQKMRYYNNEWDFVRAFATPRGEQNAFTVRQRERMEQAKVILIEMKDFLRQDSCFFPPLLSPIVREPLSLEESARRVHSVTLDFSKLRSYIADLLKQEGSEGGEKDDLVGVSYALEYIESTLERVPSRPQGIAPLAPGPYGETYHILHEDLWSRGGIWISRARDTLLHFLNHTGKSLPFTDTFIHSIETLIRVCTFHDNNTSLIVVFDRFGTKLFFIPRDVRRDITRSFSHFQSLTEMYDFMQYGPILETFFHHHVFSDAFSEVANLGTDGRGMTIRNAFLPGARSLPETVIQLSLRIGNPGGIVILTTSKKHVIELGELLQKTLTTEITLIIQGVAGGKQKMLSRYKKDPKSSILIGLYDTWIDTSSLWDVTDGIILAKVPFDPPSDIFFLARTVGMENNFMEYSLPLALIKLRRLQARVSPRPIVCLDTRLWKSDWGKHILRESDSLV